SSSGAAHGSTAAGTAPTPDPGATPRARGKFRARADGTPRKGLGSEVGTGKLAILRRLCAGASLPQGWGLAQTQGPELLQEATNRCRTPAPSVALCSPSALQCSRLRAAARIATTSRV